MFTLLARVLLIYNISVVPREAETRRERRDPCQRMVRERETELKIGHRGRLTVVVGQKNERTIAIGYTQCHPASSCRQMVFSTYKIIRHHHTKHITARLQTQISRDRCLKLRTRKLFLRHAYC